MISVLPPPGFVGEVEITLLDRDGVLHCRNPPLRYCYDADSKELLRHLDVMFPEHLLTRLVSALEEIMATEFTSRSLTFEDTLATFVCLFCCSLSLLRVKIACCCPYALLFCRHPLDLPASPCAK